MSENSEKVKRKISDNIFILYLISLGLMLFGSLLGYLFVFWLPETDLWLSVQMYLSDIGIWGLSLLFMYLHKRSRPVLTKLTHKERGNNIPFLLLGFLIGFVLNGSCALAAWLNKDIMLYYDKVDLFPVLLLFVSVFVQSSAEEMLTRGFLYSRLRMSYRNPLVAIIGNTAFFTILHVFNPGFTVWSAINIFLSGLLFSLFVNYYDSIWCAMALHTAWNFTQNILFGLPNSGIVLPFSIFKLDAASARDSLFYNVGFGIEGTAFSCVVLTIGCLLVWFFGKRHREKCACEQLQK
ncbi:MAG: CPBP family intramembrane metalloprotease [Lachnospiraceae bacterium]|nr:CPBP family intramembrane metalloprotease [Lachnospiraceae bacterium]